MNHIQTLLENVKEEFLETAGRTLDKAIKKNFRGDAKDLLRTICRGNGCAEGKEIKIYCQNSLLCQKKHWVRTQTDFGKTRVGKQFHTKHHLITERIQDLVTIQRPFNADFISTIILIDFGQNFRGTHQRNFREQFWNGFQFWNGST